MSRRSGVHVVLGRALACAFFIVGPTLVTGCSSGSDPASTGPVTKPTVIGAPAGQGADTTAQTGPRPAQSGRGIPKSIKQLPNQ